VPGVEQVLFAVRRTYDDSHWYANIGYYCDDHQQKAYSGNGASAEGRLMKLDLNTGKATVLLDAAGGSIRDPQVHYDGTKAIFSYLKAGTEHYHLYEIQLDGSGLRQLTDGPYDDYEPSYLPDGGIVFVSTRCRSWVACWMTQVGVLYRCDADGTNIRRLSFNTAHDNTPWVLPDGRILYTRWEYVDRSQVEFHHLWTMNPDGTNQMPFFGNMHPGIVMIAAKPIPGSDEVLTTFSPGHGITDHRGFATIVSPKAGPDQKSAARQLHSWPVTIKDPYPVSPDVFLVAHGKEIRRMDRAGNDADAVHVGWRGRGVRAARDPAAASRGGDPTTRPVAGDDRPVVSGGPLPQPATGRRRARRDQTPAGVGRSAQTGQLQRRAGPGFLAGAIHLEPRAGDGPGRGRWIGFLRDPRRTLGLFRRPGRKRHVGPTHAQLSRP
jgi:hypothetical protein